MDINEARSPTDEMQALVLAGVDGYCFIEKDAKVDPRAGSHAPKVVLCEPFITNQAGSLSSLTSHPGALPGRMVREDVLARSNGFLTWFLQAEDIYRLSAAAQPALC